MSTEFNEGKVVIRNNRFAIVKALNPVEGAFATIIDDNETTLVIEESRMPEEYVEVDKGWRMLTFDMILPFELVGFLAKIATLLADEGIPIYVISSYSTDHILVKEKYLEKAVKKLESAGFVVH